MRREGRLELERSPRGFAAARLTLTNGTESNPTNGDADSCDVMLSASSLASVTIVSTSSRIVRHSSGTRSTPDDMKDAMQASGSAIHSKGGQDEKVGSGTGSEAPLIL